MPLPVAFANDTQPTGQDLDNNFAALGQLSTIACTISGTNSLLLTPLANTPSQTAYQNYQSYAGFAAATNSGSVLAKVGALANLSVFKNTSVGPALLTGTEIVLNGYTELVYNSSLGSGSGGFLLTNPVGGSGSGSSGGAAGYSTNLHLWNSETVPDTQIALTMDAATVSDGVGTFATIFDVDLTIDITTTGANGLDTGTIGPSSWYACYVIYNPTTQTTAGLISLNFNSPPPSPPLSSISGAPTLPSGYTLFMRAGAMLTDGTSKLKRTVQRGNRGQFVVTSATNTALLPLLASGAAGTYSTTAPTWSPVTVTTFVPPTANQIHLTVSTNYNNGAVSNVVVAPSSAYGGILSTNPPPHGCGVTTTVFQCTFVLQTLSKNTIYWASSAAGAGVQVLGWTDSING